MSLIGELQLSRGDVEQRDVGSRHALLALAVGPDEVRRRGGRSHSLRSQKVTTTYIRRPYCTTYILLLQYITYNVLTRQSKGTFSWRVLSVMKQKFPTDDMSWTRLL